MASVAYQSSQIVNAASGSSVIITKPTSLAVGDLMLAHIDVPNGAGGSTAAAPAGWTTVQALADTIAVFYKVADSTDVAASNFTFTTNGGVMGGAISRFMNAYTVTPVDQSSAGASSSISGITPTVGDSMFVILASTSGNDSTVRTHSAYAIVTNNPTWTERYDQGSSISAQGDSKAMATSNRPEITASGNASLAISGATNAAGMVLLNIAPFPITPAVITTTGLAPTVRNVIGTLASIIITPLLPTITAVLNKWNNSSKHSASFTDTTKHSASPSNVSKHSSTWTDTTKS